MAFAAALPLLTAASPALISTFGGGGKSGGGGGMPMGQDVRQEQSSGPIIVENNSNLVGGAVTINLGGNQQVDGTLAGERYLDRGVDEPGLYAPFGTMQNADAVDLRQPMAFADLFSSTPAPGSPTHTMFIYGGAALVVAGVGFALLKKKG
jgi:hypothetical protein